MLEALSKRFGKREDGFTLIELMVVVLIIAILIAIAVPTFLGARERAQNRVAQSNIRNAAETLDTYYTDSRDYTAVTADLTALEPQLTWTTSNADAAAKASKVAIFTNTANGKANNMFIVLSEAETGVKYCIARVATGANAGTYYENACTGAETETDVKAWNRSPDGWK